MSIYQLDQFHSDPSNWKLGIFYFCRADPRIIVPKRIRGLGWTLNFGRPLAVPAFCAAIGLIIGAGKAARHFGADYGTSLTIKLIVALGLIGLCYRLARTPKAGDGKGDGPDAPNP
jgi:hypothetical protein